jgi:small multidrug resistance family-3 protein
MDFGMSGWTGKVTALVLLGAAAVLEVAGDALIRRGLRGGGVALVVLGFCVLGSYGLVVNQLQIDFSRMLGAYVGLFALASVAVGRLAFNDGVPTTTWVGLVVILAGSFIIHLGTS